MLQFRFWLLASVALSIAGCQFPLFGDRVSSIWQRENPDQQPEGRPHRGDNRIQQVSAEVPVETSRQQQIYQLLSRGNQELTLGRLTDAQIYFRQALDVDPTNFHAHHMLARIGDQTQQYEEAEGHYLAALSSNPTDPNLLSDMGYSYLLQGEYRYADSYLKRALKYAPSHVMARRNLAALAAYQGDYPGALGWLRQVGSEPQAQTTLRELIANRPPQFRLKNDPRSELPPDATPAAQDLAAHLLKAKEQAAYEEWKRDMAEWNREQAQRTRAATRPAFDPRRPRQMGQGIPNENLQEAMRAVDEDYRLRAQQLEQRQPVGPQGQPTWNNPGPQSMQLAEQMRREAAARNQQGPLFPQGQPIPQGQFPQGQIMQGQIMQGQIMQRPIQQIPQGQQPMAVPHHQGQMQYQPPVQGQQQYRPPANTNPNQMPYFDHQSQLIQRGVHTGGQIPSQRDPRSGLNRVPENQVELIPAPADFGQQPQGQGVSPSAFQGQPQDPRVWNPQSAGVQSAEDAAGTRRALDLGMSIGPGSLFPLGSSGTGPAPDSRSQPGGFQPGENQTPGLLPATGSAPIQTPAGQPGPAAQDAYRRSMGQVPQNTGLQNTGQPGQRLSYEAQAQQPNLVPSGVPGYSQSDPGARARLARPYFGEGADAAPGVVHMPSQGEGPRFNTNWQLHQIPSSTWNNETSQPIGPEHHRTQPAPLRDSFRTGGAMASPTMSSDFARPHYVTREQQQIQHTSHTHPAGTSGSTGAMRSGTAGTGSPIGVRGTSPDFRPADGSGMNQLRALHNGQF